MKSYHPASWSAQARKMCDNQIELIESGWATVETALRLFSNSYRAPLIRSRAAKRFGRKLRAGKIKIPAENKLTEYEITN